MEVIDRLYSDFRKIRHDFANYVQSNQFESEDEDFILRLRVLKKQTLELTNKLLVELEDYIDTDQTKIIERYSWLCENEIPPFKKTDERGKVLTQIWTQMKEYYLIQLQELPNVKVILLHLQDRLERSLPPDEYEAQIHLDECDSVQCHITADNVLIAAYAYIFKCECQKMGAQFRFQLPVPKTFEGKYGDLFYLLGLAKQQTEEYLRNLPANAENADKEQQESRPPLVRIRFAIGMGLWHFTLEYGIPCDETASGVDIEELSETSYNIIQTDKHLRRILKKREATIHCTCHDGLMSVDIAG